MKIIFLDIDGVLNYNGSKIIDNTCLENLKYIVKETGAKIVLISTWKQCLDDKIFEKSTEIEKQEILKLREIFYSVFNGDLEILGVVEDYFKDFKKEPVKNVELSLSDIEKVSEHSDWRSVEIKNWLDKNGPVDSFVIIDDFDCDYSVNYPNNWVRTWWFDKALRKEDAEKAVFILNCVEKVIV